MQLLFDYVQRKDRPLVVARKKPIKIRAEKGHTGDIVRIQPRACSSVRKVKKFKNAIERIYAITMNSYFVEQTSAKPCDNNFLR